MSTTKSNIVKAGVASALFLIAGTGLGITVANVVPTASTTTYTTSCLQAVAVADVTIKAQKFIIGELVNGTTVREIRDAGLVDSLAEGMKLFETKKEECQ